MNKLRLQLKKLIKHINIFLILTNQQVSQRYSHALQIIWQLYTITINESWYKKFSEQVNAKLCNVK